MFEFIVPAQHTLMLLYLVFLLQLHWARQNSSSMMFFRRVVLKAVSRTQRSGRIPNELTSCGAFQKTSPCQVRSVICMMPIGNGEMYS